MTVQDTDTTTKAGFLSSDYICRSSWAAQTLGVSMLTRNVGAQTRKIRVMGSDADNKNIHAFEDLMNQENLTFRHLC